jgi:hypothetical protein
MALVLSVGLVSWFAIPKSQWQVRSRWLPPGPCGPVDFKRAVRPGLQLRPAADMMTLGRIATNSESAIFD